MAVLPRLPWLEVDAEISAALEERTAALRRAGARVGEAQPERFDELRAYYDLYRSLLAALVHVGVPEAARQQLAAQKRAEGSGAWADGIVASALDYIIRHARRERYRASYRAFFREWDVLLSPANIVVAFPHTSACLQERAFTINGAAVPYDYQSVYASLASLTGQPAPAFPAVQTRAGLPIELQVIGPSLEDRTSLHFAELLAEICRGVRRPPGYTGEAQHSFAVVACLAL